MIKLILQLRKVSLKYSESIVSCLDLLHFYFDNNNYSFSSSNKIRLWGQQLSAPNLKGNEKKVEALNAIFFESNSVQVDREEGAPLFIKHFIDQNYGNSYLVSLVYQYLLFKMGVQFSVWSEKHPHLIKIMDKKTSYVINLENFGQKAVSKDLGPSEFLSSEDSIRVQFYYLLSSIANSLLSSGDFGKALLSYDCIIEVYPEKFYWLARRGLLKKNRGQFTEALSDLSKYVDFVDDKKVSHLILDALVELEGLKLTKNHSRLFSTQH